MCILPENIYAYVSICTYKLIFLYPILLFFLLQHKRSYNTILHHFSHYTESRLTLFNEIRSIVRKPHSLHLSNQSLMMDVTIIDREKMATTRQRTSL